MNSFALCPLQSGYNPKLGNGLLEQALLGGFARQRVQFVNNVHQARVSVLLDTKAKQQYFWAFWRKHTQSAPQPFMWRLIFDDFEAKDYECQFVAGSDEIGERDGLKYKVSFEVRAKPKPSNAKFDEYIVMMWQNEDPSMLNNFLEKFVNEELPKAMAGV